MAPILVLVKTVVFAILEVFILCTVGYFLSRQGIVDDRMKKGLNKINVSLFTPALLFSKVAFSLSPQKLVELWIVPVGFVIVTAVSMGIAFILGPIFRLQKSQTAFAMACAAFGNSNSLPIALMQSLVATVPGLKWGDDDSKDQMLGRALSYLVLYSTLGIILRWSIGVRLLSQAGDGGPGPVPASGSEQAEGVRTTTILSGERTTVTQEPEPLTAGSLRTQSLPFSTQEEREPLLNEEDREETSRKKIIKKITSTSTSPTAVSDEGDAEEVSPTGKKLRGERSVESLRRGKKKKSRPNLRAEGPPGLFYSFPNTPANGMTPAASNASSIYETEPDLSNNEETDSEDDRSVEEDEDIDEVWGVPRSRRRLAPDNPFNDYGSRASMDGRRKTKWEIRKEQFAERWKGFRMWLFTWVGHPLAKVWKGFVGFMTVPLWAALASIVVACIPPFQHFLIDHFPPVKDALRSAGNCSVPVTLVTLGAYFYRPPPKELATSASNIPSTTATALPPSQPAPIRRPTFTKRLSINNRPKLSFALPRQFGQNRSMTTASTRERKEEKRVEMQEWRTIFVAILVRMVLVPALLLPLLAWYCIKTGGMNDDPVFVVTAALIIGSPPAITLAQITSAASGDVFERMISKTLFISYAFITPPTTIALVTVGLWIDSFQ
ncbi:hypothetical protein BT69DRAFT_1238568 [Atractiella rhizophila]|nr:hypothetical protein BT69DRAFT_1238568 [Atractiella rhizophila]